MARIRLATAADVLRIVDMTEDLRAEISCPVTVNRAWTAQTIAGLISDPDSTVWVSDGGFIAGQVRPTISNPAPVAFEMGWYASDGSGLRFFEKWASSKGATMIQLATGADGPDLSRLGYRLTEKAWVK